MEEQNRGIEEIEYRHRGEKWYCPFKHFLFKERGILSITVLILPLVRKAHHNLRSANSESKSQNCLYCYFGFPLSY
jgi:hypothetical protein